MGRHLKRALVACTCALSSLAVVVGGNSIVAREPMSLRRALVMEQPLILEGQEGEGDTAAGQSEPTAEMTALETDAAAQDASAEGVDQGAITGGEASPEEVTRFTDDSPDAGDETAASPDGSPDTTDETSISTDGTQEVGEETAASPDVTTDVEGESPSPEPDSEGGEELLVFKEISTEVEEATDEERVPSDNGSALTPTETSDALAQRSFVMPEDVDYEPGVVLLLVDPSTDPALVTSLIGSVNGVVAREVSADELAEGLVNVELEEGVEVEDAVNAFLAVGSDIILGAQPNYLYSAFGSGTVAELRALVAPFPFARQLAKEASPESEGDSELTAAASVTINDPRAKEQWALTEIKAYEAWAQARGNRSVAVAVMDGGVDVNHKDLADNLVSNLAYNAVTKKAGAGHVAPDSALYNHASHVVGIIGASANNLLGVAGVSYNARVIPIKIFSGASASTESVVEAYRYLSTIAKSQNVRVVNLSVGAKDKGTLTGNDAAAVSAIRKAFDESGIVTVCAAGNSSLATPPFAIYPGDYSPIVSVINLEQYAGGVRRSSASNYNVNTERKKNISAPGTNILSTTPGSSYGYLSGTSMAAPCVAGVLALEFAANGNLSASQAVSMLYTSATDLGPQGWDQEYGYGEVNAALAVTRARGGTQRSDISGATVTLSPDGFIYDGKAKAPAVTVTLDGATLKRDVDYTVSYANNVNVGTATVTITAKGSSYTGSTTRSFRISRYSVADASVSFSPSSFTYSGSPCTPSVTVSHGGTRLTEGRDYSVSYATNVNAGTASVTVAGRGDYVGSVTKTFPIARRSLAEATIAVAPESTGYTGGAHEPAVTVTYADRTLQAGTDYDLAYSNNVSVGTATITIVGKGNFIDTVTKIFAITRSTTNWRRLEGENALDTMAAIVNEGGFPAGGTVVLATIDGYWDALTAAGIAGLAQAPVLMTSKTGLSAQTVALLSALAPRTIVACGGPLVLPDEVLAQASGAAGGAQVERVWGENALGTADEVFRQAQRITGASWSDTGFVCTIDGFWDALSAAPVSYARDMPIFLSDKEGLTEETLAAMAEGGIRKLYLVGGPRALSDNLIGQLQGRGFEFLGRLYGENAIDTSTAVANYGLTLGLSANHLGVATGKGYWDALSGAALCGRRGSVIILVNDPQSSSIGSFVASHGADIATGYVFGGPSAVSDESFGALVTASAS